jgi:hypothetical protein
MIVTVPAAVDTIKNEFSHRFDQAVLTFYDFKTRERGYMVYTDRNGGQQESPLMNLSIGVLTDTDGPFPDIRMLAAEARRRATHASGG